MVVKVNKCEFNEAAQALEVGHLWRQDSPSPSRYHRRESWLVHSWQVGSSVFVLISALRPVLSWYIIFQRCWQIAHFLQANSEDSKRGILVFLENLLRSFLQSIGFSTFKLILRGRSILCCCCFSAIHSLLSANRQGTHVHGVGCDIRPAGRHRYHRVRSLPVQTRHPSRQHQRDQWKSYDASIRTDDSRARRRARHRSQSSGLDHRSRAWPRSTGTFVSNENVFFLKLARLKPTGLLAKCLGVQVALIEIFIRLQGWKWLHKRIRTRPHPRGVFHHAPALQVDLGPIWKLLELGAWEIQCWGTRYIVAHGLFGKFWLLPSVANLEQRLPWQSNPWFGWQKTGLHLSASQWTESCFQGPTFYSHRIDGQMVRCLCRMDENGGSGTSVRLQRAIFTQWRSPFLRENRQQQFWYQEHW